MTGATRQSREVGRKRRYISVARISKFHWRGLPPLADRHWWAHSDPEIPFTPSFTDVLALRPVRGSWRWLTEWSKSVPYTVSSPFAEKLMALVKASRIAAAAKPAAASENGVSPALAAPVLRAKSRQALTGQPSGGRRAQASERVAAATEELASGLTEAAAAAEELRRSMEQIASGADEAAGASREQLAALESIVANLVTGPVANPKGRTGGPRRCRRSSATLRCRSPPRFAASSGTPIASRQR